MKRPLSSTAAPRMRKEPVQARAQRTVETIFDATARILEEDGYPGLNTNRIAERAGFSIGTLYQYFPSKEAVLLAMSRRRRDAALAEIAALLDAAVQRRTPPADAIRDLVRLLLVRFGGATAAQRALARLAWQMDHQDDITQALREGSERIAQSLAQLLQAGAAPGVRPPTPAMMFVVTRAVMGAIRSASLERSALLGDPGFEAELVALASSFLRSAPPDDREERPA